VCFTLQKRLHVNSFTDILPNGETTVVQILVKDPMPMESCTSILDPHMKTFDSVWVPGFFCRYRLASYYKFLGFYLQILQVSKLLHSGTQWHQDRRSGSQCLGAWEDQDVGTGHPQISLFWTSYLPSRSSLAFSVFVPPVTNKLVHIYSVDKTTSNNL